MTQVYQLNRSLYLFKNVQLEHGGLPHVLLLSYLPVLSYTWNLGLGLELVNN